LWLFGAGGQPIPPPIRNCRIMYIMTSNRAIYINRIRLSRPPYSLFTRPVALSWRGNANGIKRFAGGNGAAYELRGGFRPWQSQEICGLVTRITARPGPICVDHAQTRLTSGAPDLIQLIYASAALRAYAGEDLRPLVMAARAANGSRGVSGML